MADSLQEQLRALGLAKDKPRSQGKAPRKPKRGEPAHPAASNRDALSLEKAYALKEREERQQADRARKRQQAEERQRRELNRRIREIVEPDRQNREDAEIARNFIYKGRIRKIYVTAEQQAALNRGELGVVYLSGSYHLLAADRVDAVRQLSPEHVPDLGGADEDDGDHPVPDDLIW